MTFRSPTDSEVRAAARTLGFSLSDEEREFYREFIDRTMDDVEWVCERPDPQFAPHEIDRSTRGVGREPAGEDNPHNVWINRCDVRGDEEGPLSGKTVGLKDNVSLAGVEMTCGSRLLKGYTPTVDATVVTRLLDAGADIKGKLNMESFGFSTSSDNSDFGTVTNPWDTDRIAGGSSSGSGVAPAIDEVDIAIGCDQGASIRVPAACCGIVGLDPTTGLVPYTGAFPLDNTMDHIGPMAKSVEDVAVALEVMAGVDGLDPRQPPALDTGDYTAALVDDVSDIEIAVLREGFDHPESEQTVNDAVREALATIRELGATTREVSVPRHETASKLAFMIWGYGGLQIVKQAGQGSLYEGWYNTELMEVFEKFKASGIDELSDPGKATLLLMEYFDQNYPDPLYGKSQNLSLKLRNEYETVFEDADVIALPTLPVKPFQIDGGGDRLERLSRETSLTKNTAPFTITNHPSISIPVGLVDGLPVGLQLVSTHFDETKLVRVAYAFEQHTDWQSL